MVKTIEHKESKMNHEHMKHMDHDMSNMKHDMSGEHKGHEDHKDHHRMMLEDFKRRFRISLIVTIPILILSPLIQRFFGYQLSFPGIMYVLFVLSSFIFVYGGYPFLKGMVDELKKKNPGMMTLIAIAISVAYVYSSAVVFSIEGEVFFWELATLIDIMLVGHWIEMRSVLGASRALEELVKIMPSDAHLMKNGETVEVKVDTLKVSDKVLVKPGEKVPIDGIIIKGETSVNQAMITGESKPVSKETGDEVIGGAINGEGSIIVEVGKTGKDTYLNQVVEMVKQAQESKSRTQDLANRAAFILTIIAISVGILTFFVWILLDKGLVFAIERTATVMVIACPHALGLAVPLVIARSTAFAATSGLLIRDRTAFEAARNIEAIVFDKTGTLTEGDFGITDIISLGTLNEEEILSIAASLETNSEHPIAMGIVTSANNRNTQIKTISDFKAIPGKGIEGKINEKKFKVVSPGYLLEAKIVLDSDEIEKISRQGKTIIYLLEDEILQGAIALADIIREESKEAIRRLKGMGIKCMMLTGDNKYVAKWVAEEVGLDDYIAEVLPHEKASKIEEIQKDYIVAMVGDGINDAPALAKANVGIAIGAGTDVAIETADIVLVRNDPRDVADILALSRNTYSKMFQNLLWATGYNSFAIPLAAGVLYSFGILLSPAIGAVLMSLSTVIVAINARLLKKS
ncbi:MAG: heavy metal translocating P-type ATPase [Promethearchaeota archaeon]